MCAQASLSLILFLSILSMLRMCHPEVLFYIGFRFRSKGNSFLADQDLVSASV